MKEIIKSSPKSMISSIWTTIGTNKQVSKPHWSFGARRKRNNFVSRSKSPSANNWVGNY